MEEEDDFLGRSSLSFDIDFDTDDTGSQQPQQEALLPWKIPLPSRSVRSSRQNDSARSSAASLLLPRRQRQGKQQQQHSMPYRDNPVGGSGSRNDLINNVSSTGLLFGDATLQSTRIGSRNFPGNETNHSNVSSIFKSVATRTDVVHSSEYHRPNGLAGWFFGFMYEETYNESFDYADDDRDLQGEDPTRVWNTLNIALFASYTLTSAATALPILLIPSISQEFVDANYNNDAWAFTSRAASSALLGSACGKFLNGPVVDVYGARRTSSLYAMVMAAALIGLAVSRTAAGLSTASFFVEFFQSVQWPSVIVVLATHYRPPLHKQYESGIYLTSIGARLGALMGIPLFSVLLRQFHWRIVCLIGAWVAMIGSSIMYLFVTDSQEGVDEPQNPLHHHLLQQLATVKMCQNPKQCLLVGSKVVHSLILNNIVPSFRHVLLSGTFWIVALAHTGSAMVRTSERIMESYYLDTSMGYLSEKQAGGLSVSVSMGTILGLAIAGKMFAQRKERQQKQLVSRLYVMTISACYFLAILAIPQLRYKISSPELILFFQLLSSLVMGFGIAVMYSLIPGLVGSAFANHKGLYFSYTDGVANGISSLVWTYVAGAVENGNPDGGGWAYGWAAVALLIVLCAILMVVR